MVTDDQLAFAKTVSNALGDGKGYSTILKEIVEDIAPQIGVPRPSEAQAEAEGEAAEKPAGKPASKGRPAIKISMNAKPAAPAQPDGDAAPAAPAGGGKKKIIIKR